MTFHLIHCLLGWRPVGAQWVCRLGPEVFTTCAIWQGPPARRRMAIEETEKPELYVITKPIKADPWFRFWELWRSRIAARRVGWIMVHACLEGVESWAAKELESFADNHQHAHTLQLCALVKDVFLFEWFVAQTRLWALWGAVGTTSCVLWAWLTQGEMERKERETQIKKAGG